MIKVLKSIPFCLMISIALYDLIVLIALSEAGIDHWFIKKYRYSKLIIPHLELSEQILTASLPSPEVVQAYLSKGKNREDAWKEFASGLNLRARDLKLANLHLANLFKADLRQAKLEGAFMAEAELGGTDLMEANLKEANLNFTQLEEANLFHAQLRGAYLSFAKLHNANLEGANLEGAILEATQMQGANLAFAHLNGANLMGAQLQGANLMGVELQGAFMPSKFVPVSILFYPTKGNKRTEDIATTGLQGAYLIGSQLQGANLARAELQGANLSGAQLQGTNLREANLHGADLTKTNLQGANLEGAKLQGACLKDAQLPGAFLDNINIGCADFTNASLTGTFAKHVNTKMDINWDILLEQLEHEVPATAPWTQKETQIPVTKNIREDFKNNIKKAKERCKLFTTNSVLRIERDLNVFLGIREQLACQSPYIANAFLEHKSPGARYIISPDITGEMNRMIIEYMQSNCPNILKEIKRIKKPITAQYAPNPAR